MPEKDKDKNPRTVSETDTLRKKAKLVEEAPTGEEWEKITSDGEEIYVKKSKRETPPTETPATPPPPTTTKTKYKGPPPSNKPKPKPKPKDTPKEEEDTEEVVILKKKTPPAGKTGMFGGSSTYENIDPAKQWGADYGITTVETPDAEGRFTNTSRKYNLDKEGREVTYDEANPLKNFKDGKFVPTYTGRTIEDIRKEYTTQQIETPAMSGVNKANPNYKGSLMMPGTKATRIAGGGGGEFNQMNVGKIPGALSTAPVGYIEQKYDTQGNPIVTPNVGVQMDTKNITPLRKGEMEVGKMYDIPSEEPVLIPGKFAKGGSVKAPKMKKYFNGTEPDGTPSNPTKQNNTQGSIQPGTVQIGGGKGQYGVAGNATTATGATSAQVGDTKAQNDTAQQSKQDKARQDIGGALGAYGKSYVASAPDTGSQDSTTKTAMGVVSDMGVIGGVIGGAYGIIDEPARKEKNIAEQMEITYDSNGKPVAKLKSEAKAKDTAIAGSFLSPSEALSTRAAYGGWTDLSGKGYTKYLEKKAQEQLDPYIKANTEYKQQQAIANRNAGNLEGAQATDLYNLSSATFGDDKKINIQPAANGGVIGAAKMRYAKGGTIVGKGGPKDDAILTKSNEKGIAPGSFIVPAENNNKAKGIRAALFGDKNKKAEFKKEGGETKADVAVSNGEHLFTPKERKKIVNYLGEEILEELAPNAEENNEEMSQGGLLGTLTDRENMREYKGGGLTKSKAKIMLHEGIANGKPITEQQRKYFGWVAGGSKESKMDGGDIHGYEKGGKIMAPKMEKYKKGTPKKGTDQMERRDVALEELRKADEEQALKEQQAQEDVIMTTPVDESQYITPEYTKTPKAPKKGLADYVASVDPGVLFSAYQIGQGSKLLKSGQRPEDISKIDPTWNANVERAQREAAFGYTPEQAALLEQQRINALNDARFSGKNLAGGSASTAFQQERQAINQGWSNALQLKSSDQQLRMEKQRYADQAARDRASFLDSQRRRAFGDAMTTYDINQESGSALVGAGVRNAIGAYRYQKELDAQEKAAKVAGAPVYKV